MKTRSDPSLPLFHFLDVPASDASAHPGALRAMYNKQLDGLILRGVYTLEAMEEVMRRLADESLPYREPNTIGPKLLGRVIVGEDRSLEGYFEDGARQRQRLQALFEGLGDFEDRLTTLMSALSGGLPAQRVMGPEGGHAPPATVRMLPEGREIGVHVGNDFAKTDQMAHFRQHIDLSQQISFFMTLSVPQSGGELVVYGLEHSDAALFMPPAGSGNTWYEGSLVFELMSSFDSTAFTPGPGDLLIFDGGRYFHRVAKTVGPTPRCTLGGFFGFGLAGDRVFYWS